MRTSTDKIERPCLEIIGKKIAVVLNEVISPVSILKGGEKIRPGGGWSSVKKAVPF